MGRQASAQKQLGFNGNDLYTIYAMMAIIETMEHVAKLGDMGEIL